MMESTPIKTARRLSRRADQNCCLLCGRRRRIERHHPTGKNHDPPFTVPLCQACHALATENLLRAGVSMRRAKDSVECVRSSLQGSAVFLEMLAEAMWRWSESLKQSTDQDRAEEFTYNKSRGRTHKGE